MKFATWTFPMIRYLDFFQPSTTSSETQMSGMDNCLNIVQQMLTDHIFLKRHIVPNELFFKFNSYLATTKFVSLTEVM